VRNVGHLRGLQEVCLHELRHAILPQPRALLAVVRAPAGRRGGHVRLPARNRIRHLVVLLQIWFCLSPVARCCSLQPRPRSPAVYAAALDSEYRAPSLVSWAPRLVGLLHTRIQTDRFFVARDPVGRSLSIACFHRFPASSGPASQTRTPSTRHAGMSAYSVSASLACVPRPAQRQHKSLRDTRQQIAFTRPHRHGRGLLPTSAAAAAPDAGEACPTSSTSTNPPHLSQLHTSTCSPAHLLTLSRHSCGFVVETADVIHTECSEMPTQIVTAVVLCP